MEQKLSIAQLIQKIDNPGLVSAQLTLYNDWLVADNQYTMENLLPLLMERLKECNNALSDVSAHCRDITSGVEGMADSSSTILGLTNGLYALFINNGNLDSPLRKEFTDLLNSFSAVDADIRSIMIEFLDKNFEELAGNITEKIAILAKLNETLSTRHFDGGWAKEKLRSVKSDVQKYSDNLGKKGFQHVAAGLYGKYRQLYSSATIFQAKMFKKKAMDPLFMGEQQVRLYGELDTNLEQLGKQIHELINAVYRHEQLLSVLVSQVKIFLLLTNKLLRAEGKSKDRKHATEQKRGAGIEK